MKRRLFSAILSLIMLLSLVPMTVFADTSTTYVKASTVEAGKDYLIVAKDSSDCYALSGENKAVKVEASGDSITLSDTDAAALLWNASAARDTQYGKYEFTNDGTNHLYRNSNNGTSTVKIGANNAVNEKYYGFSYDGTYITNGSTSSSYRLRYSSGGKNFAYAISTTTSSNYAVLYEASTSGGGSEEPETPEGNEVYSLTNKFEIGKTYLIVSANNGEGKALTNTNSDSFGTANVTVSGNEIVGGSELAKAEWEAKATGTGDNLIGLYNGSNVLKVKNDTNKGVYIFTNATSYSAGGFGYTANGHVSYPYSKTDYYIGWNGTTFVADSSESDLGQVYIFVKGEAGEVVEPTSYTVTFNMKDHGVAIEAQTVAEGSKATKPADPTAEGYIFDGWYANEGCTEAFDFNAAITADTNVYAKWTEVVPEGDVLVMTPTTSNPTETKAIAKGASFILRLKNGGSDTYTFNVTFDKNGVATATPNSVEIAKSASKDVVITGVADGNVTISISNNSTYGDQYSRKATINLKVGEGDPVIIPDDSVDVKADKDDGTTTEKSIEVGQTLAINLTHESKADKEFTVTTNNAAVASVTPETLTVAKNATGTVYVEGLTAGTATITMTGVNVGGGNSGSTYKATINLTVTSNGGDVEPTTYTVTFNMKDHGAAVEAQTVTEGNKATKPADPTAEGYTFGGWYADESFTTAFNFDAVIAADTTVYAKWTKNPEIYTVTFNMNGHGEAVAAQTVTEGNKATRPTAPTEEGYTFGGWFEDEGFNTGFDFDAVIAANTTVYAKWTKNPDTYTVNFEMNGHGVAVAAQTVTEGNKATRPTAPTEEGYTFGGWFADEDFTTVFDFDAAITADTTVYVKWTKNPDTYTVTFNMNGHGTDATQPVVEGSKVTKPATDPTAEGYTFGGWYADENCTEEFNFDTAITANTTVYAKWTKNPAPVTDITYVAFTSDVHNQSGDTSSTRLNGWINKVTEIVGAPLDNMGFTGDLGPAYGNDFWPNAQKVMDTVANNTNVKNDGFYVCGNHEYNPGNYSHNANATTQNYSDAGTYYQGNGYILYSVGATQGNENYTTATRNALSSFLAAHKDYAGPIFVLGHYPLHCYNGQSGESTSVHDGKAAQGSAAMIEIMNDYPNVIFLWGHNHSNNNDHYDKVYTDKINSTNINFTYAAAGCMSDSEYGASANVKGKGLVAAINGTNVVLTYYDANGKVVGTPASISLTGEGGEEPIDPPVSGDVVYKQVNSFELGKTYLIVSVNNGEGKALTNTKSDSFGTADVTVSDGKIVGGSELAAAEWKAQPTQNGKTLIGLFNDGNVLKVNASDANNPYIKTEDTSYNAGGFGYTSSSHVSYPYGNNPKDYFIGWNNNNFVASASENGLGEVYLFEKVESGSQGGEDNPPATGDVINVTPSTNNPTESKSIEVGEKFTVRVTNGSTQSAYDFTVSFSKDGVATADTTSVNIAAGATKDIVITGATAGTVTITIANNNSYGSSYTRKATINLTVTGEGGEDPITPPAPSGDAVYVAFSSDVHNGSGSVSSADRLNSWINKVVDINGAPLDNMGFCGDMGPASGSSDSFWNNAQTVMNTVKNNTNVVGNGFYVCGNHEYNPGNYSHNLNDTTRNYSDAGEYIETADYIFYSLGARQWDETYSDADINAMSEFLSAHSDFGGPIFILSHFPLHSYSSGGYGGFGGYGGGSTSGESSSIHDGRPAVGSAKIINVLNEYPNVIYLWGHNHSSSSDHYDAVYTDKINDTEINFTYAAAGCMSDSEYGSSGNVKGKGLVAAIYDDSVVLTYYGVNGNEVGTGATIPMSGSSTPATTYTITASAGANGSISPNGAVEVKEGRSKTFTFAPDAGYEVDTVLVNGEAVSVSGNSYTMANVSDDATISVSFKKIQGTAYTLATEMKAGQYILVSNGYALYNNNGKISAVPVTVSGDTVIISDSNVAGATWTFSAAAGADKSGDYVVKSGDYYFSRVSDSSGSSVAAEITKEQKNSEASGLPYYQWTYDVVNGQLKHIGGQDKSATFYAYYDTSANAFYTASSEQSLKLYVVDATQPEHQHSFGDWTVVTAATCTEKGTEQHTCSCGEVETREIEALGHDVIHHDAKAATCTEAGWNAYDTCSRCDYTTYVAIDALNHDFGDWTSISETQHQRVCANDASHVETANHNFSGDTCVDCGYTKAAAGYSFSGSVKSFGDEKDTITIQLLKDGQVVYTTTVTGNDTTYAFDAVADGNYTLKATKHGHAMSQYDVIVNGEVKQNVELWLRGDVNEDGEVTDADAVYLLYNTFFGDEEYPIEQPCDFNGDGEVTDADAVYLLYYTFFGDEDYPLH